MLILTLAKRFLLSDEKRSFRMGIVVIATLGVLFACCAVTVTLGVLAGYQRVHTEAVLGFGTHLVVFKQDGLSEADQRSLEIFFRQSPFENDFTPYHFFEALIPTVKGLRPVIFKGVDPEKMLRVYHIPFETFSGSATQVYAGQALLGLQRDAVTQQKLRYVVLKDKRGQRQTRYADMKVGGTFESGFYDFDSRFILMPITTLQSLFFDDPLVSGFEVRLKDPLRVYDLKAELVDRFGNDFDVMTWDELNAGLFETLKLERTVVLTVTFLVLMIACLNIFGFNFLFFIERKREFMILAALGLGLSRLRRLMILLSLFLGGLASVVGTASGLGLLALMQKGRGIPLNPEVYFIDRVPVFFEPVWFLVALIGSLALCWITSFLAGRVVLKRYWGEGNS